MAGADHNTARRIGREHRGREIYIMYMNSQRCLDRVISRWYSIDIYFNLEGSA